MSKLGRCRRRFSVILLATLGITDISVGSQAQANGRFPASTNVEFQPGNDTTILLSTTFGLLVSSDDGAQFHWVCEETIGYGGTYDPDYSLNSNGDIYATTFDGVQVSRDGACTFSDTEFYADLTGGDNPAKLEPGYFVSDIEVASNGHIWAATSTRTGANNIYRSSDGNRFDATNAFQEIAWWESLRVSKSNPGTAYATGYQIPGSNPKTPAKALLFKTTDGGANWINLGTASFAFGRQPHVALLGISPINPDIVFAKVTAARAPEGDDLYRSSDGGLRFTKVLEMNAEISAFSVRSNDSIIVGQKTPCAEELTMKPDAALPNKGCVRTSSDGTTGSFVQPPVEPKMGCVGERSSDNKLFACGHNWDPDNFAAGFSNDEAQSWTKLVRLGEITGPLSCPDGTIQHTCELNAWPSVCTMLGICGVGDDDAGMISADSGITITPPGDDSCLGCQSGDSGGLPFAGFVLAMYLLMFRRRRA